MDAKIINNHNMTANGFFLTRSQDAANEQAFLALATEMINERLKEKSLRSSNVLDNLPVLEDIVQFIADSLSERRAEFNISPEGLYAYVWVTTIGCISAYNEKIRRIKESTKLTRVPIRHERDERQERHPPRREDDYQFQGRNRGGDRGDRGRDERRGRQEYMPQDGRQSRGGYYGASRTRSRSR